MADSLSFRSTDKPVLENKRERNPGFAGRKFAGFDQKSFDGYHGTRLQVLVIALLASAVVALFTYPKYLELLLDPKLAERYSYFFHKIDFPLSPVHTLLEQHASKIDFRLTIPLLARLLNVSGNDHSIILIYLIQSALLIPFFYVLIQFLRRYMTNTSVLFFVIGSASVYLCKAFIWDYDFWFDGYAYFFLLLGMYFQSRPAIFLTLQLACWTDERAVVALSSIYLFHLLAENKFDVRSLGQIFGGLSFRNKSSAVLLAGIVYLIGRQVLSQKFGLQTPTGEGSGVQLSLIPYQLKHRLSGIFLTFEGLWLIFILCLSMLVKRRNLFLASILCVILTVHLIIAYSVYDISRSITYAFPLIIISAILVAEYRFPYQQYLHQLAALLCVLIPTQFLIFFLRQIPWTIASFSELKPIAKAVCATLNIHL